MSAPRAAEGALKLKGRWDSIQIWKSVEDYEAFKRGEFVMPLFFHDVNNGITDEGIHYLLEAGFRDGTKITAWYAGLIDNSGYTGVDPADTMASHTGWSEATQYDEADRQTLTFGAAATRKITASVSFTMNATKTIEGIFVTSDNTKSGTTGTLWSTALFSSAPGLVSGNVLTANYTLSD